MDWGDEALAVGAFWQHDGNHKRPYAMLTSGMISNVYFNGGLIASEYPRLLSRAANELSLRARGELGSDSAWRCIGPAKGAICLSFDIATMGGFRHAWADKVDDSFSIDSRFSTFFAAEERFILVEDTITTAGSIERLRAAVLRQVPKAIIAPVVLALCNRSGMTHLPGGERIVALLEPDARVWPMGENPFTPDGEELVMPVRPKEHWDALTRAY